MRGVREIVSGRSPADRLMDELEVECGASVQCVTDRVSAMMGIDIEVQVLGEAEWQATPRHVLVEGDRARIPVRASDPRWYRLHVVVHELAHLLSGDSRCTALPMSFDQLRRPAQARVLMHAGISGFEPDEPGAGEIAEQQADVIARRLGALL